MMNSSSSQNRAILLLIAAILLATGIYAAPLGLSSCPDSRAILERSVPAILHGHYVISRSYGNPLHEVIATGLDALGGYVWINYYSLLMAIAALFVFDRLLGSAMSPVRRAAALAAFAFSPLFFVNIATTTEWTQLIFLTLCLLWLVRCWMDRPGPAALAGIGFLSALIVLTRPDAVVTCAAVFLAAVWRMRFDMRRGMQLCITLAIAGIVTLAIYGLINDGFAFLHSTIFGISAPMRRLIVGIIGLFCVFGQLGGVLMLLVTAQETREAVRGQESPSFWTRLYLVSFPLFMLRFLILSDKLEYIICLPVFFVLMAAHARMRTSWLVVVALAMIQSSFINLSLFERTGTEDKLSVTPRITPGALEQDLRMEHYNYLITQPAFLGHVADTVYHDEPPPHPVVQSVLFKAGLTSSTGDLIIGRSEIYRLDNPRMTHEWQRSLYRRIYACDKSMYGGTLGWRKMERPVDVPLSDADDTLAPVQCERIQ